jgi:predicted nucleotidyltransferase
MYQLASASEVEALGRISRSLSALPEVETAILFGSRSRGDFTGSSDFDILVVITDISAKNKVIGILHDIELEYDMPIAPVIFTSREYEVNRKFKSGFIENIERDGIVLHDARRKK